MPQFTGTSEADTLNGTEDADVVDGLDGGDTLNGLGGADEINGGGGDDFIDGGEGDDEIDPGGGADFVSAGGGNDTIHFDLAPASGASSINTHTGDDTVIVTGGLTRVGVPRSTIRLSTGNDHLIIDLGATTERVIVPNAGNTFDSGRVTSILLGPSPGAVRVLDIEGFDRMTLTTGSGDDVLHQANAADIIDSGAGNDRISSRGAGADNWLVIGRGRIDGGAGTDVVDVNWSDLAADQPVVWDTADPAGITIGSGDSERYIRNVEVLETFRSGAGDDQIIVGPSGGTVSRQTVETHDGDDIVTVRFGANVAVSGTYSIELGEDEDEGDVDILILDFSAVVGSASNTQPNGDSLFVNGSFAVNGYGAEMLTIIGSAGNDSFREFGTEPSVATLRGEGGNDYLEPGWGVAEGGAGLDRLALDFSNYWPADWPPFGGLDIVIDDAPSATGLGGHDGSFVLGPDDVIFTSIEHFNITTGFGYDDITTRAGDDVVNAGWGDDVVHAGAGNDTAYGESGDDLLDGEAGADLLIGGQADDTLLGGIGNDQLLGGEDDDRLDGGAGIDRMEGSLGDDVFAVDHSHDLVVELLDEGSDTVESAIDYALGADLEHLTLTGAGSLDGTGNALANTITGNGAANVLRGMAGDDTLGGGGGHDLLDGGLDSDAMAGGLGNDTFIVDGAGDSVSEAAGEGLDRVASAISFTLGDHVENLTLAGAAAIDGTGNALGNLIAGNGAANRLDGGLGVDRLQGGGGDDTYVVDNIRDTVTESGSAGIDLVESSVDFGLASNLENLTLTGVGNIDAIGNGLANLITGNAGANLINGGAGADTMHGLAGNDVYFVDHAGDQAVENDALDGIDMVKTSVTFTLGAHVENLTLTGNAALAGTGNDLDNALIGNSAANALNGGAGADRMKGGAGNDSYTIDNVGDQVTESASEGVDTVLASVTFTLAGHVEHLTLTGGGAIDATGNTLGNTLTGNGAANILTGGLGNDRLLGSGGADTLKGGTGIDRLEGGADADQFVFDAALIPANRDLLVDFEVGSDTIVLENARFTGLAAGALDPNAFRLGSAALDADDRILYDAASGVLRFDADGSGAGAAIQFAILDNLPATLAASDFTVI